jgi:Rrf2 family transcriptional regulator, cysteine metabolism repressor
MNISVKGRYALEAIFDLSTQPPGEPVKIADIAKRRSIPQKFLELILAGLKQGGFVESRRGAEGGYRLARSADQITVGEVLRYVEGVKPPRLSRNRSEDPLHSVWEQVEQAVSEVIDHTTFGQLAEQWSAARHAYVPNWEI